MRQKSVKKSFLKICSEIITAYFFPSRCPLCDSVISYGRELCQDCEKKISYIKEPLCKKCGKQIENKRQEFCSDCSRKKHQYIQGKAVFSYQKELICFHPGMMNRSMGCMHWCGKYQPFCKQGKCYFPFSC